MDFAVPAGHRVKLRKNEKRDMYQDLARKLKKRWNIKVTVIPSVIGVLGTVTKGLVQGVKDLEIIGRVKTIQTTALFRSARILRRVLETCCHSKSSENPLVNADVKNSQLSKIIIMIMIIIEYSKLILKEYKTRLDWVGKVIHWE